MHNSKLTFCIGWECVVFHFTWTQCCLGYMCRLENTNFLQRRNWSISIGNWSLVGVKALMTSTSLTLMLNCLLIFHFHPLWQKCFREKISCYIILDCFTGARSGRRNQSTSPKRAQMKHKMCPLLPSFICPSIEQLIFWILDQIF